MPYLKLPSTQDTGTLACLELNQDFWLNPDYANRIGTERVCCSLEALLGKDRTAVPGITMPQMLDGILKKFPDMYVGRYISALCLDDTADSVDGYYAADPPRRLPGPGLAGCVFEQNELVPNTHPWVVDITQPKVMHKLLAAVLSEVQRTRDVYPGLRICKTDNWFAVKGNWAVTLEYFRLLNQGIQQLGLIHLPNFSPIRPEWGILPDSSIQQIAKADIVHFEAATAPAMLATADGVAKWLHAASLVSDFALVANDWGHGYEADHTFCCGLAMILGARVGYPLWMARPDCIDWPKKYGSPLSAAVQSGMTITRAFDKGMLTVDCAARTVQES